MFMCTVQIKKFLRTSRLGPSVIAQYMHICACVFVHVMDLLHEDAFSSRKTTIPQYMRCVLALLLISL